MNRRVFWLLLLLWIGCGILTREADGADPTTVTVTAVARFVSTPNGPEFLELYYRDQKYQIVSGFDGKRTLPCPIAAGQTYQFILTYEDHFGWPLKAAPGQPAFSSPYLTVLVRVGQGERLLYDREICEVHHRRMSRREVPIEYGLSGGFDEAIPSLEEQRAAFPHALEFRSGGCIVGAQKTAQVFVCEECKRAHRVWLSRQPKE